LSFEGELLGTYAGEITGLEDDPIDLRLNPDGRLLIAEQKPARIRSCDPVAWACRDITASLADQLKRQFKVLLTESQHGMLVSDARGDALWGVKGPGEEIRRLVDKDLLAGPNDLAFDDKGHLWLADTDHRRIIELLPAADGTFETGRQHSAINQLTVDERFYPMMLAPAQDGKWWVTQAAEFSDRYADLVVYDPDEGAIKRVELPGSVFATDIAAAGEDMLITDLEQFRVYRVNSRTHRVSTFGDEQFTAQMHALKAQRERYLRMSGLAMAGVLIFGILMVVAAVLATPRHKRWTRPPGLFDPQAVAETVPPVSGVHWLQRNPALERSLKWVELTTFVIVIVMIAGGLGLYGWMLMQAGADPVEDLKARLDELGLMLLVGGLLLAGTVPLLRYATRGLKHRLGSDGRQLYIQLSDGRELVVPPTELAYTHQVILYRQHSLPVQTGKRQSIYLDGEVETWLAPLLLQAERLSPLQALRHQWRHSDALLMWSVGAGVVFGLLMILLSLSGK
jgi:streptogramin lyase